MGGRIGRNNLQLVEVNKTEVNRQTVIDLRWFELRSFDLRSGRNRIVSRGVFSYSVLQFTPSCVQKTGLTEDGTVCAQWGLGVRQRSAMKGGPSQKGYH